MVRFHVNRLFGVTHASNCATPVIRVATAVSACGRSHAIELELALRARAEDNGGVNVRNAADETGTRTVVDEATQSPKGESMADESGVMLPGSREEMRFLRKNSNWVNMIIAILACWLSRRDLFLARSEVDSNVSSTIRGIAERRAMPSSTSSFRRSRGWTSNEASIVWATRNTPRGTCLHRPTTSGEHRTGEASENWAKRKTDERFKRR